MLKLIAAVVFTGMMVLAAPAKADGRCPIDGAHSPETLIDALGRLSPYPVEDVEELTKNQVKVFKDASKHIKLPTGFEIESISLIKYKDGTAIIYFERGDHCILSYGTMSKGAVGRLYDRLGGKATKA